MDAADRCRDIFPLPSTRAEPLRPGSGLSRGTRQRIERRFSQQSTVCEVIDTFNDIFLQGLVPRIRLPPLIGARPAIP